MDMTINGIPLSEFGGVVLMDYTIGETPITTDYFQGINRTNFNILKSRFALRQIQLNMLFGGATLRESKMHRSRFNAQLFGRVCLYIPEDGYYYTGFAESLGAETVVGIGDNNAMVQSTVTLRCVRHDPAVTKAVQTTDKRVFCESTMPLTDCRYTVTVTSIGSSGQYNIAGVVFSGVSVGDVLAVDTIDGRITRNGSNVVASFTAFPQLVPGKNTLTWGSVSGSTVTPHEPLTLLYYPIYI